MLGSGRVVVGVSGSPGSLRALRYAAMMARTRDEALIPVFAWVPPGGNNVDLYQPSCELRKIWHDAATERLNRAIAAAWGDVPPDLVVRPQVERGAAGRVLTSIASQPGDVLVIGAGRRGWPTRLAMSRVSRYCVARARCPVVLVPPPDLARALWRTRLAWTFGRRFPNPERALGPGGTQAGGGPVRA